MTGFGSDPLLVETAERLFRSTCTFEAVEHAEGERWAGAVWDALAEAGFPWVSVPEAAGGSGGSLVDAAALLRAAGAVGAPVPLAETGLLAGWLLASAGLALPEGPATVIPEASCVSLADGRVRGVATVAWAERAERIVACVADGDGWRIVSLRPDQLDITPGANMAGEPRDTVTIDVTLADCESAAAPVGVDGDELARRGSLSRIVLAAGAIESMTQLAVDYTSQRRQFGKPVASFQAVQQHLVHSAQFSVKASMAAALAVRAMAGESASSSQFALSAARVVVDDASVRATRAVHQAHGAMGVTREYPLHHLSRRLWSWRHEYRPAARWKQELATSALAAGSDGYFALITGG